MPGAGPNLIRDETCPFCRFNLAGRDAIATRNRDTATVQCPVCGPYEIVGTAVDIMAHWTLSDDRRMAMAFALRRMTDRPNIPLITSDVLRALRDTAALPAPEALLDEAVLWFGSHSPSAGHSFQVSYNDHRTALGWSIHTPSISSPSGGSRAASFEARDFKPRILCLSR